MSDWEFTTQEDFTQSQEMPTQYAMRKRGSIQGGRPKRYRGMGRRVPRAIQTRGTPDGYYEIPSQMLIRLYFNSTTGIWPTTQTNNQPTGATGYEAFAMRFDFDEVVLHFGNNGAINTSQTMSIPGATELGAVFDEFKQVRVEQEYWLANQVPGVHTSGTAAAGNPEFWVVEDQNDAFPPTMTAIQQYAKSTRVMADKPVKVTHTQKVVLDAATDAGSGASTSVGPMVNTYMKAGSNASLLGTKVYFWIPQNAAGTAYVGYLNIKLRIVRRYKKTV